MGISSSLGSFAHRPSRDQVFDILFLDDKGTEAGLGVGAPYKSPNRHDFDHFDRFSCSVWTEDCDHRPGCKKGKIAFLGLHDFGSCIERSNPYHLFYQELLNAKF
jgi:hypothetical protein